MARKNRKNQVDEVEVDEEEEVSENIFTYIGGGEDSPRVINFMGLQKFVRGKPTEVTNKLVLDKLKNGTHKTIVPGTVDQEDLHEQDEEAVKEADQQRQKDKVTQAAAMKQSGKWANME